MCTLLIRTLFQDVLIGHTTQAPERWQALHHHSHTFPMWSNKHYITAKKWAGQRSAHKVDKQTNIHTWPQVTTHDHTWPHMYKQMLHRYIHVHVHTNKTCTTHALVCTYICTGVCTSGMPWHAVNSLSCLHVFVEWNFQSRGHIKRELKYTGQMVRVHTIDSPSPPPPLPLTSRYTPSPLPSQPIIPAPVTSQ